MSVYRVRSKTFCGNSGTVPSFKERDGAPPGTDRVKCDGCGRDVAITKNGLIAHHSPTQKRVRP